MPLAIASVTPKDVPVGSSAVTIVVTGTGFTPTTVIQLSGASVQTTFISSTEIRATIPASQLQKGTILKLSVVDGTQVVAADTSNNVQVSNPVPTVSTLAPLSVLVGSPAGSVTVTGTNFVSGITLAVNGSPRTTTYVSDTQFTASLTADDFSSAVPLLLNAVNPQPGGGASGTIALVVANPAPTIASLSPSALNAGSAATIVNIVGTGFVAGTGVLVNGASRPATLTSPTAMRVALTSADLVSAGSLGITAVNPGTGWRHLSIIRDRDQQSCSRCDHSYSGFGHCGNRYGSDHHHRVELRSIYRGLCKRATAHDYLREWRTTCSVTDLRRSRRGRDSLRRRYEPKPGRRQHGCSFVAGE